MQAQAPDCRGRADMAEFSPLASDWRLPGRMKSGDGDLSLDNMRVWTWAFQHEELYSVPNGGKKSLEAVPSETLANEPAEGTMQLIT